MIVDDFKIFVVIPFQTKGFYNWMSKSRPVVPFVVIPFQTKGFYNKNRQTHEEVNLQSSYPSKRRASTTPSVAE